MIPLRTYILLSTLAVEYQNEIESFNRQEISKKINEIKYLAGQKNVPKLTLRREIAQLEQRLHGVYELEKKVLKLKKIENVKIGSLKRQNTILKKKLEASQDKNLHHKVGKLSHLLGENLARKEVGRDVGLHMTSKGSDNEIVEESLDSGTAQLEMLYHRLSAVKSELEMMKEMEKDISKVKLIEAKILLLQEKLDKLGGGKQFAVVRDQPKHTMKFDLPIVSEHELPLPPPPKIEN
ncbi:hypothetical protein HQ489_04365 [Candidatus Woesearchaeota archaeon]|nr:hypothetical protein [Candidatus Woesearchaeota archaeon]